MAIKVFFNNSCNVCRLEINHYKKIADSNLEWIDITNNDEALKITSKSQEELLRRLHVIDDGKVIGGAKAFIIIWSKIPKYNFLAKILILDLVAAPCGESQPAEKTNPKGLPISRQTLRGTAPQARWRPPGHLAHRWSVKLHLFLRFMKKYF